MTPGSSVVVLVVEDEFFSRLHAVDLVNDADYTAIEASNADEAIAILEARKDIRIVLTDIDMPGSMDGLKLAHAIRKRWPPIELILTSGHHFKDDDMPERGRFFPEAISRSRDRFGATAFCCLRSMNLGTTLVCAKPTCQTPRGEVGVPTCEFRMSADGT